MCSAAILMQAACIAAIGLGSTTIDAQSQAATATCTTSVTQAEPAAESDVDWTQAFDVHLPDPELAQERISKQLSEATRPIERTPLENLLTRLKSIDRPEEIRVTLSQVLNRAMENSFAIRVSSYNPAIDTTQVVEAEAAFDALFYLSAYNNKVDQPTFTVLQGSSVVDFNISGGVRQLLPTGMQVDAGLTTHRSFNNFQFQTVNPQWTSQFVVQFRQPLLRGFGLDYNRSQISLARLGKQQSVQEFKRDIRDTLRQTEEAYWRLVQARRNLVVAARLLADFEQIYSYLDERKEFDVYRIQLADTRARLERSKADFVARVTDVRNAEDQLIALVNDPDIDLADNIEIIPLDSPVSTPVALEPMAEVQTALEHRAELVEAKLGIDSARIQVGVAKNQALPTMDLIFQYTVDGLGESADDSFDMVTKNDYHEYYVGFEFELPVGNRARRAALQRAKLQHAQAIATLKQAFEQVLLDVNVAVREVQTNYDQIQPALEAASANDDQVKSIQARAEKKDYLTLSNELSAHQSLASTRASLLESLINYNIALVDLERAKGTLLEYNNVELIIPEANEVAE